MDKKNQRSKIKDQKQDNSSRVGRPAQTMAELLASAKTPFVSLSKGSIVNGIITKIGSSGILVDIGSKAEAVVLEKDNRLLSVILSNLKVGDSVQVSILNPESDNGNSVVSLRHYISDFVWNKLEEKKKNGNPLKAVITGETRGGFLVDAEFGISGFLPNSQTQIGNKIGDKLDVFVLDFQRSEHRVIFSQRPVIDSKEFERLSSRLKAGIKVKAVIANIASFGLFVTLDIDDKIVDGFIHISEISWEKVDNLGERFKIGDKIEAIVIGFDNSIRRVNLSLRLLTNDPFEKTAEEKFLPDTRIKAKVSKIITQGVVFDLGNLEGMIKKVSIPIGTTYKVGDDVDVMVSKIDKKKRKIMLVPVLSEKPMGYR